ncbi:hypothetical protein CASFOL_021713 [Castilleja foliolosa]|uniref:UBC core domain-containing protein n=1 Tax=Castilleja foliolosa TaxID=1961234 RepID=A0ABD3CZX9_9LAMI
MGCLLCACRFIFFVHEPRDISGTVENHAKIIDFPHFSVVREAVDHTYLGSKQYADINVNSSAYRHIMKEWKILDGEKNLPDSIYVQAYETRIDLMRAVIVGSPGTPYHDGLFFFDICLPFHYPNQPPKVHYISHGYKLNPNILQDGRVCLSLINTWKGDKGERWSPKLTILQTLVSIQALVLNDRPYFNNPALAFAKNNTPPEIEGSSIVYNHIAFEQSCKSMISIMRNPPKNFENFVVCHFRARADMILTAARDYEKGRMMVGMIDQDSVEGVHNVLFNIGRIRLELVDAFSPYISEAEAMINMDDNNDDDDDVVVKTKENMKKHKRDWSKFICFAICIWE